MDFRSYLRIMVEREGSDLYFSAGAPVSSKIHGALTPVDERILDRDEVKAIAWSIMDEEQIAEFEHKPEMKAPGQSEPGKA